MVSISQMLEYVYSNKAMITTIAGSSILLASKFRFLEKQLSNIYDITGLSDKTTTAGIVGVATAFVSHGILSEASKILGIEEYTPTKTLSSVVGAVCSVGAYVMYSDIVMGSQAPHQNDVSFREL